MAIDPRERQSELELTQLVREGRHGQKHTADAVEHLMRMPYEDLVALERLYPGIFSHDVDEQTKALDALFASPFAEKYRVARTPTQVQRAPGRPIFIR